MFRTSPLHKENYSRPILTVVVDFYQRCSTTFQELISTGEQKPTDADPKVALAADWAQRRNLRLFEIYEMSEIDVEKNNLIGSTRNLATLGSLYTSLVSGCRISSYATVRTLSASQHWSTDALDAPKAVSETPLSPTTPLKLTPKSAVTTHTAGVPFLRPFDPSEQLQFSLSEEMSV